MNCNVLVTGGFHRIRHYGMLANSNRRDNLALASLLLQVTPSSPEAAAADGLDSPRPTFVCMTTSGGGAVSGRDKRPLDAIIVGQESLLLHENGRGSC